MTRADHEAYTAVKERSPTPSTTPAARAITLERGQRPRLPGVVVCCAGTSDVPVAEEAAVTAEVMGRRRTACTTSAWRASTACSTDATALGQREAIVVVAGMEGALPSVVAGLVGRAGDRRADVVGYGASFGGLAPLLAMLNACAAGVAVVNIDNGFGAGYMAAVINRQSAKDLANG